MPEYIERETLISKCKMIADCDWNKIASPVSWSDAYESFADEVETLTAADVAPVVHCWQCKNHEREQDPCHGRTEHYCKKLKTEVYKDFFCGYGARMDGE